MKTLLDAIEKWASTSAERVQLLIVLTCVTLAVVVLAGIGVMAYVLLPQEMLPF